MTRVDRLAIPKVSAYRDGITKLDAMRALLKSTTLGVGVSQEASGIWICGVAPHAEHAGTRREPQGQPAPSKTAKRDKGVVEEGDR